MLPHRQLHFLLDLFLLRFQFRDLLKDRPAPLQFPVKPGKGHCPAGLCAAKILLYHLIAGSAPIRRRHGPFHHMVIPESPFHIYEPSDQVVIPFQPSVDKSLPQYQRRYIPYPLSRDRHVVVTLHHIVERDVPVGPLVRIVGAGCLAFQPGVFPDDQPVHIRDHKWVLHATVHKVGAADF